MAESLKRILYVEDDESIAEVGVMTLEDLGGFEVIHCSSGKEALDALSSFAPQLVLMDVMMPVMDGPKTLQSMKERPDAKHIPVMFMTAKAQVHEQETYRAMGAVGVIVKPFDPMALCDRLVEYWDAAQAGSAPQGDGPAASAA